MKATSQTQTTPRPKPLIPKALKLWVPQTLPETEGLMLAVWTPAPSLHEQAMEQHVQNLLEARLTKLVETHVQTYGMENAVREVQEYLSREDAETDSAESLALSIARSEAVTQMLGRVEWSQESPRTQTPTPEQRSRIRELTMLEYLTMLN